MSTVFENTMQSLVDFSNVTNTDCFVYNNQIWKKLDNNNPNGANLLTGEVHKFESTDQVSIPTTTTIHAE